MPGRTPAECQNLSEVRAEIDALDAILVSLLSQRLNYVRSAARFKPDAASVRVPDRIRSMLQERRRWAEDADLDPDAIEKLFRDWIEYSITEELRCWRRSHDSVPEA